MKSIMNIVSEVKQVVHRIDEQAEFIMFGSRAKGDYNDESDWDFLILTEKEVTSFLYNLILNEIFELELKTLSSIQVIIRNKNVWKENLWMTPFYKNVNKEGVRI